MSREAPHQRLSGPLRAFFAEYLPLHQGVSPNTIKAYRDGWALLLRYGTQVCELGPPDQWLIHHVDRSFVLNFLSYVETERKVCVRTRNARLAAIHAFFHYLVGLRPELERHCRQILAIPTKKTRTPVLGYLEPDELKAVLASVPLDSAKGRRDLALLVFAYNTGARVHEIAAGRHTAIVRGSAPYIRILGKGGKEREVPLWDGTLRLLDSYTEHYRAKPQSRADADFLFLSAVGHSLTRFAVSRIIGHYIAAAATHLPNLQKKRLTAHSMRHTTAVHLLQGGAELNTIRTWLGHASNNSLAVYLGLDLKHKHQLLEHIISDDFTEICLRDCPDQSTTSPSILDFLDTL